MNMKKSKDNQSLNRDLAFIYNTQPKGGISFKEEFYNRFGDSYGTCIRVFEVPTIMTEFWLLKITQIENATVIVDHFTDTEVDYKGTVLPDAMEEIRLRRDRAKTTSEFDSYNQEYERLRMLNSAINDGEQIKRVQIRIFVYATTLDRLEKKVNDIFLTLGSSGYQSSVVLDEQKEDWLSMYLPINEQIKLRNNSEGMEIQAEAMGLAYSHNQTFLHDESGAYYGYTRTGGTVYWDIYYKTTKRLSYNFFLAGTMGSGKSSQLKKIIDDNLTKGNFASGYDKSGEFRSLVVNKHKGRYIPLDGSQGIMNMLQVYPSVVKPVKEGESESEIDVKASFGEHTSTLGVIYRTLNREASSRDITKFEDVMWDFYVDFGIWENPDVDITQLPAEAYPTLSDLVVYLKKQLSGSQLDPEDRSSLKDFLLYIESLTKQYGHIFDGVTTITDLTSNPAVFFDISSLSEYKDEIFDCQFYISFKALLGNIMKVGKQQKEAFDQGKIHWFDIKRFLVIIDECHNYLNLSKPYATKVFSTLMSEARKFFISIGLATQMVERMFPKADNVSDSSTAEAANSLGELFTLTQYKIILKQDSSSIPFLRNVFGKVFTETEYQMMTQFQTGKEIGGSQGILNIAGDQNLHMTFQLTDEEVELFAGGA